METAVLYEQSSGIICLPRVWVQMCEWYPSPTKTHRLTLDVVPFEYLGSRSWHGVYLLARSIEEMNSSGIMNIECAYFASVCFSQSSNSVLFLRLQMYYDLPGCISLLSEFSY